MTACFFIFFYFLFFLGSKDKIMELGKRLGSTKSLEYFKPGTSRAVIVTGYLADGLPFKYFGDYDLSGSKWIPSHLFTFSPFTLGHFRVRYRRFTVESATKVPSFCGIPEPRDGKPLS